MEIFSDLKNMIQTKQLKLVTQRHGATVYQGDSSQGKIFIKITKNKAVNERYFEILEALKNFSLTPTVLDKFEWENSSVIVMTAIEGTQVDTILKHCTQAQKKSLFYDIGLTLGELHYAIPQTHLFNMKFWKDRDGLSRHSVLWSKQLNFMISKWISRIDLLSPDYQDFCHQINELCQYDTTLCDTKELTLIHCDYIGRNILVDNYNRISGVIDFEAARIGDPIYDLAKIVWVNMDFDQLELRNNFLDGWEYSFKQVIPKRKFLYYVGIQCIAAIAWTDTNCSSDGSDPIFRASAIRTLKRVLHELNIL